VRIVCVYDAESIMTFTYTMQRRLTAGSVLTMCYGHSSNFDGGGRNGWECLSAAEFNHASACTVRRHNRTREKRSNTGRSESFGWGDISTSAKHEVFQHDEWRSNRDSGAGDTSDRGVLARKRWTHKHRLQRKKVVGGRQEHT
jgi:hypothetical protein